MKCKLSCGTIEIMGNSKLEAIQNVLQFDKTQQISPYYNTCEHTCDLFMLIYLVHKYVIHMQVKCHNQSCQLHLVIHKLKLTFPFLHFQINVE